MAKPRLLYISINDGSDTRINKEIRTLARDFDVDYVGIGQTDERSFAKEHCRSFAIVRGRHKNPLVFLRYGFLVLKRYYFGKRIHSIHIINENLLLVFLPFLFWQRRKIVLDVFDSIFLRFGKKLHWLRDFCYRLPKRMIVTDDNRKSLVPIRFHDKTTVVENFPYRFSQNIDKTSQPDELTIFYNGSMSRSRGTDLLEHLLEDLRIRVKMAGWVYDEPTQQLTRHPRVEFLGVVTQQQSMRLAAQCDYILSLYEPINENNINASPNKIYDAIQVGTPVIINREVKIAAFVAQNQVGYVLDSFYEKDYARICSELLAQKNTYRFSEKLRNQFTWEAVESKLTLAHQA
jgi:hypothetical protein